ncbi:Fe-S cluster assembly protein SufD [Salisediminibacterium halotolerans]|uniref:Fe-S cluster assembly protein SufD n=1 Tax=Salisediminibacterium halotolerans TaxID=517425 RepID=A0A1H9VNR3_9BACI|nr:MULTISPECIES: Fe-S cluster assembly protein SufD [Salisediminibacterium]RLJ75407.1 iron-regulated ABC transporter permease protein SufD [Actinophytocola xinjiangensis]RPE89261.1 iron-regulated ABC transporter permease protein SufD [Salisediminibacterium halotolerans]TWG36020.1 iron-regulated ABC transporter permease protein SufD [Salisediminibacterium halotolerans]SES22967.1 Fe-S cluster assembly protein SufD [Salisediminibacterium haloalkalitolerans]GEL07814.1 FeS cluster assembly protein 
MTAEVTFPINKQQLESFSNDRHEPKWFTDFRLSSLEQAVNLEMPKPDKTNISKWNFTSFGINANTAAGTSFDSLSDSVKTLVGEEKDVQNLLAQKNGQTIYQAVNEDLTSKGVIFTDIATALNDHEELVKKFYMQDAVSANEHRLTALHAALVNGGTFIYVPKDVEIEAPLQAVYAHEGDFGLFNHVLIVAEANSKLTYVENYISEGSGSEAVANLVAEVYLDEGAKVSFGAVDNLAETVTTYTNRRGQVNGRDAQLYWSLGQMNDGNTVSENTTYLMGEGSYGDAKTVSIGRGQQSQNFTTNIVHYGKNSDGQILKHGVMKDRATSIFNGVTKIINGATKANGEQTERVLMLSDKARGDANPILLIDEDDVTAGHAASVGNIDPLQMFYLMSRGMNRTEAERLIIHGFLAPVVDALAIETVKNQVFHVIERKVY